MTESELHRESNLSESRFNKTEHVAGARLVTGATILAVAGIIGKFLGAIFRIPLTGWIGAEGMSYYGAAYPVYSFFLILATAGLPVAISRMVSERIAIGDFKNAHKSYKVSLKIMLAIGIVSFIICFFGAGQIAKYMGNPDAKLSIMAISPALLLAPIASSFRGYFQGQQNMMPTAVSEVTEQLFRVVVGLTLSYVLITKGLECASAGATFGATAGLIAAMVILAIIYRKSQKRRAAMIAESDTVEEPTKSLAKELVEIALPITIGSTIMPFMMILDSAIVMNRLQATGWTLTMSKVKYGLISGYCDPLVAFPGVFIDAISISMIPAVTAAFTLKKHEELNHNIQTGIKTMMVVAYPCAIGLAVLAQPILTLLYPAKPDEVAMAVPLLQIMSVGVVTLSTMRTFSSALQGIGKMVLPVINLFIGAFAKIVISYVLVGIPAINVNGAAIGSVLAYLIAGILNYMGLKKYADVKLDLGGTFIKPLVASAAMGVVTVLLFKGVYAVIGSNSISCLLSILVAVMFYFILIFITKTVTREEAIMLPKGNLIVRVAEKLHLIG